MGGMRLPRFGLRVLFALITMICVVLWWLQTQRNFVRERQEFVTKLTTKQGGLWEDAEWAEKGKVKWKQPIPTISFVRKALGDRAYFLIILSEDADKKVID